jgi:hypothetical protein
MKLFHDNPHRSEAIMRGLAALHHYMLVPVGRTPASAKPSRKRKSTKRKPATA